MLKRELEDVLAVLQRIDTERFTKHVRGIASAATSPRPTPLPMEAIELLYESFPGRPRSTGL
jgi:hypothetical protein